MDIGSLKDWLGAIAIIISLGGIVYAFITSRSKINSEHLKSVDEKIVDHGGRLQTMESEFKHMPSRIADHGNRLQTVENEIKHMPTKDDVAALNVSIIKMEGVVGRLDEGMKAVQRTVVRVEEFLMEKGK